MCGIAGRVNLFTGAPVDAATIRAMCTLLAHRGPDGQGTRVHGCVGFGHRRLAIIDLSDIASQPMTTDDGRYCVTFNGEIYNFADIKSDLVRRGHRFRSNSDTEVLLHSYAEFGPDCLARLRGMFAFAIWDAAERTLFIARDRVGKKPLFYRLDHNGLAFASEPKAFLAEPGFRPQPDRHALSLYLTYGYVPAPWSAFEGVRKLPPAHYLMFKDGVVTTKRYWRLSYRTKTTPSEPEAIEGLLETLREAVRLRLVSDVPLGAFLSGGVDSSIVVALMSQVSGRPVRTYSIGFEEANFDELQYARLVAQRYESTHQEFIVRPDACAILPKLAWQYGEPFADSSAIPTYYLAELTRRHVTVALNGDAGDENFAGYTRYVPSRRSEVYGAAPAPLRRTFAALGRSAPVPERAASYLARAVRWAEVMKGNRQQRYAQSVMVYDSELRRRVCTREFLSSTADLDPSRPILDAYRDSDADDEIDAMLNVDVETYLPGDILVKVDIATMAHGLEGRSPFLDHVLMEYAAGLPAHFKLNGKEKKYLLRQAARRLVPSDLLDRPKKGFSVPLALWLRRELKDMAFDVLLSDRAAQRGIVSRARVEGLLRDHTEGRYEWHVHIYTLLMLELWFRECVDGLPSAVSAAGALAECVDSPR